MKPNTTISSNIISGFFDILSQQFPMYSFYNSELFQRVSILMNETNATNSKKRNKNDTNDTNSKKRKLDFQFSPFTFISMYRDLHFYLVVLQKQNEVLQ